MGHGPMIETGRSCYIPHHILKPTLRHHPEHNPDASSKRLQPFERFQTVQRTIRNYSELYRFMLWMTFWTCSLGIYPALKDRGPRTQAARDKLAAVKKTLGLPTSGPGTFTRALSRSHRDALNKRELVKLDVEFARLKARC